MIIRILLSLLAMSIIYSIVPNDLLANGGGRQIYNGILGQFLVTARMAPPTPRPGMMHLTVELTNKTTNVPITDASVRFSATGPNSGTTGLIVANNKLGNTNFYDANLNFSHEGLWNLTIEMTNSAEQHSLNIPLNLESTEVPRKMWIMASALVVFMISFGLFVRSKDSRKRI